MTGDHFDACLARLLQFETSYPQPVGGPYVRFVASKKRPVSPIETGVPDGLAFDDDPQDTGGRTSMGILQREYDAWRRSMGLAQRDVWLIEDRELTQIYRRQYWDALRCGELPPGVDMLVFDAGVNCGVGIGARLLQRALGVTDDGHVGQITIAAAWDAPDHAALVAAFETAREAYHRQCRTFNVHGSTWLRRTADCAKVARGMLAPSVPAAVIDVDYAEGSRRSLPPPPAASVAETATGQRELVQGAVGAGLGIDGALETVERVNRLGLLDTLMQHPGVVVMLIIGVGLVLNARNGWLDRYRKLILGV